MPAPREADASPSHGRAHGRTIATARIIMPRSMVRLSAGRMSFSPIEQAVMFLAGANSIFTGDKLLTTANPAFDEDEQASAALPTYPPPARPGVWVTTSVVCVHVR
jgi:biotin synthase